MHQLEKQIIKIKSEYVFLDFSLLILIALKENFFHFLYKQQIKDQDRIFY